MTVDKKKVLEEIIRRNQREAYRNDFKSFAEDNIKIITKNVSQGFVPFEFNDAQNLINEKIEEQRAKTGRVRAIILKARQQGISTYCAARVFWKTYYTQYSRSVVMAHDLANILCYNLNIIFRKRFKIIPIGFPLIPSDYLLQYLLFVHRHSCLLYTSDAADE